ncbi:MAG: hypothetical protein JWN86_2053 [Planctomycetota bacterium]|nr:hypothetical protein [Planctomycetota bacterium]
MGLLRTPESNLSYLSGAYLIMDPISKVVQKAGDLLGHSPHPAIVTLPLGAWAFSNISDGLGLLTGEEKYDDAARLSMAVGLVGAAGAAVTGLYDYSKIPVDRPSHDVATTHALGNSVVATLFATSYVMRLRDYHAGRRPSLAARLLALTGGGLSLWTAYLGGKLVEEMGEGVKPVMDQMGRHELEEDAHGRERLDPSTPLGMHRGMRR